MKRLTGLSQLRYEEDRAPVLLSALVLAAQVTGYLTLRNRALAVGAALLLFIPQVMLATVVHNHAHVSIFKRRSLNHILEVVLFLQTGMFASMFRLHHNNGHHLYYMDPQRDPSTWVKPNGKKMGRLRYIARYYFTYLPQVVRIGRKRPRLLVQALAHLGLGYSLLLTLVLLKPFSGAVFFLAPALLVWLNFIHFTYDDHIDLFAQDPFQASHTKRNPIINKIFFNSGYHMAHHLKPGLHWSRLPAYHGEIQDKIAVPPPKTVFNKLLAS